jgi:hypothetical protein
MTIHRELIPTFAAGVSLLLTAAGCNSAVSKAEPVEVESDMLAISSAPDVPDAIKVPAGNKLVFAAVGNGVQVYVCQPAATAGTFAWTLRAPEAKLYGKRGREIGHHAAGPLWESIDGSTVVGTRSAKVTVDPTAIDWLLLDATTNTGPGEMLDVTYIQRTDTTDGLPRADGCDAAHVGITDRRDYTATYYFYKEDLSQKPGRHYAAR